MTNIHPHWESEGKDVPVKVRQTEKKGPKIPQNAQVVSRQPAAIVGMITVIAAGYLFFQGVESLTGQVAESGSKTVTITEDGLSPAILEVEHGETVSWTNMQSIPHILESSTLCSDTGYCLQTKTLFEGESDNFTITLDMPAGSYEYTSATSSDIQGQIIITTTAAPNFEEITSVLDHGIFGNDFSNDPPPSTPLPSTPTNTIAATNVPQQNIPRNPYTADSQRVHPFDEEGNPIESAFGEIPQETISQAPLVNSNGRGPMRQPETGAGGLFAIIAGSVLLLWYATAHCFRKTYHF